MNFSSTLRERVLFLQKFLLAPRRTGSVIPSSRYLTRAMMSKVDWNRCHAIAELGAGTGVFTRAIDFHIRQTQKESGGPVPGGCSSPRKILVFEKDDAMRKRLALEMPHLAFSPDALELRSAMAQHAVGSLDYVISGLPFAAFPQDLRQAIFEQVSASLKPDGYFVLFQYTLLLKGTLNAHFHSISVDRVRLNFPPAYVMVFRKR